MRTVFADSNYLWAILNPKDELHIKAGEVSKSLGNVLLITTEMILTELLNQSAKHGEILRGAAVQLVKQLKENPNVKVIAQTSVQFNEALKLYEDRSDKEWSLTDCSSFQIMQRKNIKEALTHDKHFEQAGFIALLRDNP